MGLQGFAQWDKIGISLLEDVWQGSTLMSFQELQEQYRLAPTQFYRYLQLRHAIAGHIPPDTIIPEFNPMKAKIIMGRLGKEAVSHIYCTLIINLPDQFLALRRRAGWVN